MLDIVHLLPAGEIVARDGRRFRLADAAAVIAASMRGHDLVIDYEHQSEDAARRGADGVIPAAGWITGLVARSNGLWGRVKWTPRARAMLAARKYRYLSPTILYNATDGTIVRIKGAGLVHDPALELTALARQEAPMSLARIAAALDLEEDAGEDAILAAIARRRDAAEPDPAEYMPVAAVRDLLRERAETAAAVSDRDSERRVDEAVTAGYVTPAMRSWALALCRKDPASFEQFLAGAVPIAGPVQVDWSRPSGERTAPAGPEATAICAQLGLTPDQLRD